MHNIFVVPEYGIFAVSETMSRYCLFLELDLLGHLYPTSGPQRPVVEITLI